jgi:hypothetical protein
MSTFRSLKTLNKTASQKPKIGGSAPTPHEPSFRAFNGGFWNGRSYEHETRLGRIPFFALKFIQSTASQLFSQVELIIVIL